MPLDDIERRLSAILSADVVGYSRLMAADEKATVRTITAYRNEISNLVSDHRGRVVDATGDNALAEFPTALDAVECAVEIQRVLRARNAGLPEERRMEFRVGVHLGDVTVEGERIYGDGVNIAARLQGLAEPGGISISGTVHDLVESKLGLRCDDLGEQKVKNLPKPVRVFTVRDEAPTAKKVIGIGATGRPSIVVLPFVNMSADPDQEYFCDGMAEEVINALTQLEGLHVVARTSAFSFKGRDVDIREIGDKLGVRSVLEGSVRKAGDRLRVTAQLINVADGYHLWSQRYDRQLDDVFAIQDEISESIVEKLKVKLGVGAALASSTLTQNQEAYDLYLRGRHNYWLETRKSLQGAIEYFKKALTLDPDYASAHAALSLAYTNLYLFGFIAHEDVLPMAKAAAIRAVEIDESLDQAHVALGAVRANLQWDWAGSEGEFRRAIELNPNATEARAGFSARCLTGQGRMSEALVEIRRALDGDPLSLAKRRMYGQALCWDRQYDEAIRQLSHVVEIAPDFPVTRQLLFITLIANDMPDVALRQQLGIMRSAGRQESAREIDAAYAEAGEPGMLRWLLQRRLAVAKSTGHEGVPGHRAYYLALLYGRLSEVDEAFRSLDEAVRQRDGHLNTVKVHPWLDSLRSDPRYDEILKKMNLAD